ncbi:hypothetical protein EDC94DRAFT_669313 [Helicostylum pulchrum]|nr:hypothetical protein EDC94DRAFT_669313 [Helicostylum pulchrum]
MSSGYFRKNRVLLYEYKGKKSAYNKANSKDIPKEAREQINSFINSFNATDTPAGNNSYGDSYNINFEKEPEEEPEEATDDEVPGALKEPETFWDKWTDFFPEKHGVIRICPNTSVSNIQKEQYYALLRDAATVVEMYDKELNRPLHQLINDDDNIIKVPKDIISEVFEKISKSKDMNEALYYIQIEKAKLCKNNERRGDRYAILSIVEKVIEDTELWSKCGDEQELTFYRRFASIMDVMFKGSEVILSDGETGCQSSRIAIEANKCVFAGEDTSPTYSRKIDLLLKYDEKKVIDLCSNERKKSKVTNDLKLKQQSKNMRVNACIINNLQGTYGGSHSVLALDVIGLNGYMYKLTKVDNYFITTSFCAIVIPRCFSDIDSFEEVLVSLFYFKHLVKKLRKCVLEKETARDIGTIFSLKSTVQHEHPYPFVFFKSKKRKTNDTDEV